MKGQAKPLRGRSPGKRLFAAIVSLCMIVSLLPTTAFAEAGVQDSIVITGTSGLCEHHTEHTADCGYTEGTAEIPCSHEHDESCGGLIDPDTCNHTHDETCGYVPATEGTPCTYVCEICNAQDSGNPEAPSDAQPEECTCETLCTEEEINGDAPFALRRVPSWIRFASVQLLCCPSRRWRRKVRLVSFMLEISRLLEVVIMPPTGPRIRMGI